MKEFFLSTQPIETVKTIDYDAELNEEQFNVVKNGDGACLVLAGAGSGKTRTITYRVAYLLDQGIDPGNILLLTFTNKAAQEMLTRVEDLIGAYPKGLWGGTFHSIANRLLRHYAPLVGLTPDFTILDQDDARDMIKYCIKDLHIDAKAKRFPSPSILNSIISYSRNSGESISRVVEERYPQFIELSAVVERISDVYKARKQQANAVDFDDLLILILELLDKNLDVRVQLANQFKYILVDEYQDTNYVQARIIGHLASHHKNILVVGDDAQSIYSFRAADIQNILDFPKQFDGTRTFKLETNYRSTPEILNLANESILHNEEQYEKELRAVKNSFELPMLVPASSASQEAQYIAEQILALRQEGVHLHHIAVLFRAAFHSQILEMELMRKDIPYEYRGGLKFFERAHIKDIVCYLRLMQNPKDTMAWVRVLSHQVGIGAVTAGRIADVLTNLESVDEVESIDLSTIAKGRAAKGWATLHTTMKRLIKTERQPADLIRAVAVSEYRDYLENEYPNASDRLDDIEQFSLFAEGYNDLSTFLQEVSLKDGYGAVRERASDDDEQITLSTIHQAKGLEWDAVFVMHMSEGKFPNPKALKEDKGVEEERRLFYVAATRARKYLFLTYPIMSGFDTLEIRQPSMFLQEIPKKSMEEVTLRRRPSNQIYSRSIAWQSESIDDEYEDESIELDEFGEPLHSPKHEFLKRIDEL